MHNTLPVSNIVRVAPGTFRVTSEHVDLYELRLDESTLMMGGWKHASK
jgi:hypothetical protein